jgi:hypothetical protein
MSEETARRWCRIFKNRWTNFHDEKWNGRLSVVNDDLAQSVNQKNLWKTAQHNFRIFFWISKNFRHCSLRDYHRLSCHKFYAKLVLKMLTGENKTHRMAVVLNFLECYHNDGDEFRSHMWVNSGETWVSFVNVETKEQSKQWMHTHSPNKPRKFKQSLNKIL